jgi:hypothetical protein
LSSKQEANKNIIIEIEIFKEMERGSEQILKKRNFTEQNQEEVQRTENRSQQNAWP